MAAIAGAALFAWSCGVGSHVILADGEAPSGGDLLAGHEVLSRPSTHGINIRAIAACGLTASARWGRESGALDHDTGEVHTDGGPVDVRIDGLEPGTTYFYRLVVRPDDRPDTVATGDEHSFRTAPAPGTPFTFVVQADPHLDDNSKPEVYRQALQNALADNPDFLVDLGDTAMSDKCTVDGERLCVPQRPTTYEQVVARNALQRSYFERVAHSLPLFLVLGNHEGEAAWADTGKEDSLFLWSVRARKHFYANPEPDDFYSGNDAEEPLVGRRQNYYAFEWGDALIVVLDPFGYTTVKPNGSSDQSMWQWTLGEQQYRWLQRTLEFSRARFKFVFSHNMVGGSGSDGRGGAAFADKFEWGGHNVDGSWGFAERRPGWAKPIHQLLVDTGVSAWFHGHDHLYAAEQLDGVVYQEVPQPSLSRYDTPDPGGGYGYQGTVGVNVFASSGHLRVSVAASEVRVDYVRAVAPGDETETRRNGTLVHSYVLR